MDELIVRIAPIGAPRLIVGGVGKDVEAKCIGIMSTNLGEREN